MDNGQEQRRAVETAPGGYRPAGAPTGPGRLPALALCAALVALAAMFALVPAALFVERATAQEPTPEAGDAAEERQDQQECLIEPGQWFCPPPPPSGLSLRLSGEDIYVNYSRSYWETHTSHYYKFTLYRSSSRNGSYSSYDQPAEDTFPPALFLDVDEGYWYKARGVRCPSSTYIGCGDWSRYSSPLEFESLTVPGVPRRVTADGGSGSIAVTWQAPSEDGGSSITSYAIQHRRYRSGSSWTENIRYEGSSTSYTIRRLGDDTQYEVQVKARNAVGDGPYSLSVVVSTDPPPPPPDTVPDRVSRPSASADGTAVTVSWSAPGDGGSAITGYEIRRKTRSSFSWQGSVAATAATRSRVFRGLDADTEYEFQVRAKNRVGSGGWSASIIVRTGQPPATVPERVSQPSASEDGVTITVRWTAPGDGGSAITGFEIRHKARSSFSWQGSVAATAASRSRVFRDLDAGTEYEFQVRAENRIGEGDWSPSVIGETDAPLVSTPDPELESKTVSSITIRWEGVVGGYRYQVRRRTGAGPWGGPTTIAFATSYTAHGLDHSTRYDFQVRARGNGSAFSAEWTRWSSTLSASTDAPGSEPPSVPTNGSATVSAIDGSLVLSWSESDGATRYEVRIENANGASVYSDLDVSGSPHSISAYSLAGLSNPQTASVKACNSSTSCSAELDISFLPPAPAPTGMTSPVRTRTTVGLRWNAVASTTGYEHDYQLSDDDYDIWLDVPDSTTFTSRTVIHLTCGHGYFFRVRSHGDGSAYHSQWGPWSNTVSAFTAACNEEPEFEEDSYTFRAATDAETGAVVGTVEATDDEEVVSYTLTGSPLFSISKNADGHGEIAVAGSLADREGDAVLLTAKATDAEGLYDTVVVTVDVSATAPDSKAPAPDATLSSATGTSITIEWTAVEGSTKYRAQHKPAVEDDYTGDVSVRMSLSYTATGLSPGESYDFRLSAHGDGSTYIDGWGDWSEDFTFDTADPPPADDCLAELGTVSGETSRSGEWTGACDSTNRPGRHARYYTFTLASAAAVTIELASTTQILNPGSASTDTYLFLLEGGGTSGTELARNDDSRDTQFGYYNSRITHEASAGTYTAEATTYDPNLTGNFNITIRPVFETPPDPPPVPTNGSAVWNPSAGDLELSWTGSDEASTYQVRISAAGYTVRNIRRESYEIRASVILGLQYSQTALVRACDEGNTCSDDLEIEFLPPIPAPDNFRVAGSRSTEIDLAWDEVEHRAGYEHDYKESSSTRWLSVDLSTRLTSRTVTGLACGTRYDFRMRTAGGSGTPYSPQWGPWSDTASGSTAACVPTNEFPPLDSPTAEAAADGGSIDVAFRLPSSEFEYLLTLYRSADGKSYSPHLTPVELDHGDASPHTFSGLVPSAGGWYQARLKACRDDDRTDCGEPAYSNVVTLPEPTTNRPPAFDRTSYTFTAAPSATVGTSVGTAAATDEDGTVASYSLDDASRFAISSSGEISVGASLTGLAGTSVTLTLTATDDDGATATVEIEIRVTAGSLPPADAPGSLVLNHPGDTFIVVEWHASAHAAEYAIEMLRSGAWERTEGITDEYRVFERLTPGTEYRFRVQAKGDGVNRNAEEWSQWSETLTVSTTGDPPPPPGPPTNVRVVPGNNRLVVLWEPPASDGGSPITGYEVARDAGSRGLRSARAITDPTQLGPEDRGFAFLNLDNGTRYSVTVKAVSGDVDGAPSTAINGTPVSDAITVNEVNNGAPVDLGFITTVGVNVPNPVPGETYSVRLEIDDASKLSFNACEPADDVENLMSRSASATVQACAAGSAEVAATLIVGDAATGYFTIARSSPYEINVAPATAEVTIDAFDAPLDIGETKRFAVRASLMRTNSTYTLEMTSSSIALRFGSNCSTANSVVSFDSGANGYHSQNFVLKGCSAVSDATVTATLRKGGVTVAAASRTVSVRPTVPTGFRANGNSPSATEAAVAFRWDTVSDDHGYKIRFTTECVSDSGTSTSICPMLHEKWNAHVEVAAGESSKNISSELSVNTLYRAEIKATLGSLESDWSDPVFFYPTTSPPGGPIFTYPLFGHLPMQRYDYTICLDTLPEDEVLRGKWVTDIQSGVATWQEEVVWNQGTSNIIESSHAPLADCSTASHKVKLVDGGLGNPCLSITPDTGGCLSTPAWITPENAITTSTLYIFEDDDLNPGVPVVPPVIPCSRLSNLVAHEVGHALGIGKRPNRHPTLDGALMKQSTPIVCKPQPHDVSAVMALYQSR